MSRRTGLGASAALLGAALVLALWLGGDDAVGVDARDPHPPTVIAEGLTEVRLAPPRRPVDDATEVDPFALSLTALRQAIAAGEAAGAAARLRHLLRTDEWALAAAYSALFADDTTAELRCALAMVLGTLAIDGVDEVLLAALDQFGADEATALALIAALGALRDPPDEDDVFDLEQAPFHGVAGPGGMGITVRNVIRDPRVEQRLGRLLLDRERGAVRLAAASALQWSVDQESSRARFRGALAYEMDDAVASVLGEALGVWARRKDGSEAARIIDELVQAADRPSLIEYRLRLETALREAPLDAATSARLRQWTGPGNPFESRSFAFTALASQRTVDAATRTALTAAVDADPDIAMRRHAARLLGQMAAGEDSIAVLRRAFAQTTDWSLRSTALDALVRVLPTAEARALLRTASVDSDPRIVRRAQRLGPQVR